jgi:RNA polymerase sigma-70 factor, ECF subfamily
VNLTGSGPVFSYTNYPELFPPMATATTGTAGAVAAEERCPLETTSPTRDHADLPAGRTMAIGLAAWRLVAEHHRYRPARFAPMADGAGTFEDLLRKRVRRSAGYERERLSLRSRRGSRQEAGGPEALITALYYEHGRSLLAYATRLTNDRTEAEDVVQETLLRAWKHPEVLVNGQGSVRGWLLTVARNIVVDRARARSARPAEVREHPANPTVAPDKPEDVVDSMAILDAIDQLSPEHRSVLVELYWRGSSVAEAAQRLNVPSGTVKSRAYYGLQSLRGIMSSSASGEKESA